MFMRGASQIRKIMRFLILIFPLLVCVPECRADSDLPDEQTTEAAVNDLIIAPIFELINKESSKIALELVIIEDEALRGKLNQHYKSLGSVILFVARDEVSYGEVRNSHRISGRRAYINVFKVSRMADGVLDIEWHRSYSPIAGSHKNIRMVMIMGRWSVAEVKTISVS